MCDTRIDDGVCLNYVTVGSASGGGPPTSPSLKATVNNPRGSVEKLSPKESVEGADTVLRGNVRAPEGFSEGKPKALKPRGQL